jgi:Zn-dependent protease with chaperone function
MDFFAHQDDARAASRRLVVLFVLAVGGLLLAVNLLAAWVLRYYPFGHPGWVHGLVTCGTLAIVGFGTWSRMRELALGGPALAVMLGGREVLPTAATPDERRLRNVVEEMAIAAGIPVPAVFMLDSGGINAFAAGYGLNDTAIAVTNGCLTNLTRDELQALVAHEMSHLLNGDARLSLRLLCAVHGLLTLVHTGQALFEAGFNTDRSDWSSRRQRNDSVWPLIGLGVALMALGGLGWLMANLVRAGISRQREYLADAAAVQFTRNGPAVANVLKKTLNPLIGSGYSHPQVAQASHVFFGTPGRGITWFATHPPTEERIRRIEPQWDGSLPSADNRETAPTPPTPAQTGSPPLRLGQLTPGPEQVDFASALHLRLPDVLTTAAGEAYLARAVVLVMLVGEAARLPRIATHDAALAALTGRLLPTWQDLPADSARLPLLHLALPNLRRLTPAQRATFLAAVADTTRDGSANAQLVAHLVQRSLRPAPPPAEFHALRPLLPEITTVLASLAAASGNPAQAFSAGWGRLMVPGACPVMPADPGSPALCAALDRLARGNPAIRRRVVEAASHAIAADGVVAAREAELLRVVCETLALPLPAFRDG